MDAAGYRRKRRAPKWGIFRALLVRGVLLRRGGRGPRPYPLTHAESASNQKTLPGQRLSQPHWRGNEGTMSDWTYALTAKGRLEVASGSLGVPPQLRRLLATVDGRRTRDAILEIHGRSSVNAGALSLLVSGGYIEKAKQAADKKQPKPAPPPVAQDPARRPRPTCTRAHARAHAHAHARTTGSRRACPGSQTRAEDQARTGTGTRPSCSFPRGCSPEVKEDGGSDISQLSSGLPG